MGKREKLILDLGSEIELLPASGKRGGAPLCIPRYGVAAFDVGGNRYIVVDAGNDLPALREKHQVYTDVVPLRVPVVDKGQTE